MKREGGGRKWEDERRRQVWKERKIKKRRFRRKVARWKRENVGL